MKNNEEQMVVRAAMSILGRKTSPLKKRKVAANAVKARKALALKVAQRNGHPVK